MKAIFLANRSLFLAFLSFFVFRIGDGSALQLLTLCFRTRADIIRFLVPFVTFLLPDMLFLLLKVLLRLPSVGFVLGCYVRFQRCFSPLLSTLASCGLQGALRIFAGFELATVPGLLYPAFPRGLVKKEAFCTGFLHFQVVVL